MKYTCFSKDEKGGQSEWDQQIRKREGQNHFYGKLQMFPYPKCGPRGPFVLIIPSRALTVLSYCPPSAPRGKGQKITPLPFDVQLPSP